MGKPNLTNSFENLLRDSKAEETHAQQPFIRKSKGGKLIIDIDDIKCLDTNNDYYITKILIELEDLTRKYNKEN